MTSAGQPPLHPTEPSAAYLNATQEVIDERVAAAAEEEIPRVPQHYRDHDELWERIDKRVEELRDQLQFIIEDLHAHPELAFEEYRSMGVLADVVERHGFEVKRGAYGLETAFRARWESTEFTKDVDPTIVVMAEYDALPGIGHACGHNIIAAAGVGAFLSAAAVLAETGLRGRVELQGTPAEEGHTGKEYMIRDGALAAADAAVMVHGFSYDIAAHAWLGRRAVAAKFHGVAAHASSQPFMGRNALDAANLAYQGIGLLRQQMPPSDRLHAIISHGGDRPSIVPAEAQLDIYVRSTGVDTLMDLSARIDDVVEGAAKMAGCGIEVTWDEHPMSLPVRNNGAIAQRWTRAQARRGRTALPAGTVPDSLAASTDFGNVSQLVPGLHPMIKVSPTEVALHTEDFAQWANTPEALRAASDAAAGLAQVIVDLVGDKELLAEAKKEFSATGGAISVQDLLA